MRRDSSEMLDKLPEDPQPDLELYSFLFSQAPGCLVWGALGSNLHLNYILEVDLYIKVPKVPFCTLFNH